MYIQRILLHHALLFFEIVLFIKKTFQIHICLFNTQCFILVIDIAENSKDCMLK